MQLHRRQLSPLVYKREVQPRQTAAFDVIGRSVVAQSTHNLHRRAQLLRRDEQIDVTGETPTGIAVDRLAEQRALQCDRANPSVGQRGYHLQGDDLQEGSVPAPHG